MDREELNERCCSKCLRCFDEYDHYSWLTFAPKPPKKNRYYCNKQHKYVKPNNVEPCFEV